MSDKFRQEVVAKVPEVTLAFWIIKISATTLGETGGDTVTMTLNWGYLAGTALFLGFLVVLVTVQILAKRFHSWLYWATIVASTTFGQVRIGVSGSNGRGRPGSDFGVGAGLSFDGKGPRFWRRRTRRMPSTKRPRNEVGNYHDHPSRIASELREAVSWL